MKILVQMPIALIFLLQGLPTLQASPSQVSGNQIDLKRLGRFCDTKTRLVERSISLDLKKILELQSKQSSAAALDAVATVQIAMMTLNCRLLLLKVISPKDFLEKQTEILQFAIDLQSARELAQDASKRPITRKPTALNPKEAARDLGLELRSSTAASQTSSTDLVEATVLALVEKYSPIQVTR